MRNLWTPATELVLGSFGIVQDIEPHMIPPEAWSNGNNIVFTKKGIRRAGGHEQVFGTMSVVPEFIMNVPGVGGSYWIYTSLAKAYVYESGVHTNITRQVAAADVDYTASVGRQWQSTIIGGIPILNNGVDLPQAWLALSSSQNLENIPNFASPAGTLRVKVVKGMGQYLILLNCTENGVAGPNTIIWSHKADPGSLPSSFDYTDRAVDAGRVFLTDSKGGDIMDGVLLGDEMIVYKEYSTHGLRFVGGSTFFAPRMILDTSGIYTSKCACAFDKGTKHFVVTADDIIIHAGTRETKSVAEDKVKETIFSEVDPTNYVNSYVFENRVTKECWFCYPTFGNTYPNKAARWNYVTDTWSYRDFTGVSVDYGTITDAPSDEWDDDTQAWDDDTERWANQSRVQQVFVDRTSAFQLEKGLSFGGTTPLAFIERLGLAIDGRDRQGNLRASLSHRKLLSRTWPELSGSALVDFQAGKQELINGPVEWQPLQTFDPSLQRFLDSTAEPVNGLLLALRYQTQHNDPWLLSGHHLYIEKLGGL